MKNAKMVLAVVGLAMAVVACTTISGISQIGARRGTYEVLLRHPEYRPAFVAGIAGLNNLLLRPEPNYQELLDALQVLKIDELKGNEGAMLLRDIIDVYDILIGPTAREQTPEQIKAWAQSIVNGVTAGLAQYDASRL